MLGRKIDPVEKIIMPLDIFNENDNMKILQNVYENL